MGGTYRNLTCLWSDRALKSFLTDFRIFVPASRPITALLLGVLVLLGHLPAWIHVAACHDPACAGHSVSLNQTISHAKTDCGCPCGSAHQVDSESASRVDHEPDPTGFPIHDSETCPVCQSLSAPGGLPGFVILAWSFQPAIDCLLLPSSTLTASVISLPPPARGPPAASV